VAVKKSRKLCSFGIYSLSKDSALAAVGRDTKFETGYVPEGIRKGIAFLSKMVLERVRGWSSGRGPPVLNFVQCPPPPPPPPCPSPVPNEKWCEIAGRY